MYHDNRKRFKLSCVIDRLHVENTGLKKTSKCHKEQAVVRKYVNPILLQQKKCKEEIVTVIPTGPEKSKGQVFRRFQTKPSGEGDIYCCELCGRKSFKSYTKVVQVAEDDGPLKLEKKKVCHHCYNDGVFQPKSKCKEKNKIRPNYEPPHIGTTADRASKSWFFIRRDFVYKKMDKLQKGQCNEDEFYDYLSDISSKESETSEDDCDGDIDISFDQDNLTSQNQSIEQNESLVDIPFKDHDFSIVPSESIKNTKGYQEHLNLRGENHIDSDISSSPEVAEEFPKKIYINKPVGIENVKDFLSEEASQNIDLARLVTQNRNILDLPLTINVSPDPNDHTYFARTSPDCHDGVTIGSSSMDNDILESLLNDCEGKIELRCDNSNDELGNSFHSKVLPDLILDNDFDDSFELKQARFRLINNVYTKNVNDKNLSKDDNGRLPSYNRGVCSLVTVVNNGKRSQYKGGPINSSVYDSRGMYCKKSDLPSFFELHDNQSQSLDLKSKWKNVNDLLGNCSPTSPSKAASCNYNDTSPTSKEVKVNCMKKSPYDKGKSKRNEIRICNVCNQPVENYSSYNQSNAPLKFMKFFKEKQNIIRVCRRCLLTPLNLSKTSNDRGESKEANLIVGDSSCPDLPSTKSRPVVSKKRKSGQNNHKSSQKIRRFSRFVEPPMEKSSPKIFAQPRDTSFCTLPHPALLPRPKVVLDPILPTNLNLNDEIGKFYIKNNASQNNTSLGISSFGRLNLKVVQNPNENQMKNISQNCKTKYIIVQTTPPSTKGGNSSKNQNNDSSLATKSSGDNKLPDITINGHKYKIDKEIKISTSSNIDGNSGASSSKTLTPNSTRERVANQFKIVNVVETPQSIALPVHAQKFILQSISPSRKSDALDQIMSNRATKIVHNDNKTGFSLPEYSFVTPNEVNEKNPKTCTPSLVTVCTSSPVGIRNAVIVHVTKCETRVSNSTSLTAGREDNNTSMTALSTLPLKEIACKVIDSVESGSQLSHSNMAIPSSTFTSSVVGSVVGPVCDFKSKKVPSAPLKIFSLQDPVVFSNNVGTSSSSLTGGDIKNDHSSPSSMNKINRTLTFTKPTISAHSLIPPGVGVGLKSWISTSTAVSSSLVRSINELRASLTTSISQGSKLANQQKVASNSSSTVEGTNLSSTDKIAICSSAATTVGLSTPGVSGHSDSKKMSFNLTGPKMTSRVFTSPKLSGKMTNAKIISPIPTLLIAREQNGESKSPAVPIW